MILCIYRFFDEDSPLVANLKKTNSCLDQDSNSGLQLYALALYQQRHPEELEVRMFLFKTFMTYRGRIWRPNFHINPIVAYLFLSSENTFL